MIWFKDRIVGITSASSILNRLRKLLGGLRHQKIEPDIIVVTRKIEIVAFAKFALFG
jgi:hypothetical protein